MTASCGARTEMRDAPAFDVVYVYDQTHLARWHSATGAIDLFPTTRAPLFITCTRDGRFMAISDIAAAQFDVTDGNGSVLRSHMGIAEAIRPDGARVLMDNVDPHVVPQDNCIGTLDADGTYEDVSCKSSSSHELFIPLDYANDGTIVLWLEGDTYDGWRTLGTADDQGGGWRPLVHMSAEPLDGARWSPDGKRFAFATHVPGLHVSRLSIVRMDTLEVETLVDDSHVIASFGFTPDGRDIVFVAADIVDGWVVSAGAKMIDLGTRTIVPLAIPIDPFWAGPTCVTASADAR